MKILVMTILVVKRSSSNLLFWDFNIDVVVLVIVSGSDNYNCCIETPNGRLGEDVGEDFDEEVYDEPQGLHLVFDSNNIQDRAVWLDINTWDSERSSEAIY